jgi:hypothetical protein
MSDRKPDPVIAALVAQTQTVLEQREEGRIYQLAFWPDDRRAMPEDFIFSAVFGAVKANRQVTREALASINGLTVIYTGPRLNQVHADVWMGIMHLARQLPEGTLVRFTAAQLLRLIGRHTGKSQREQLKTWIAQLCATDLMIQQDVSGKRFAKKILDRPDGDLAEQDRGGQSAFAVVIPRDVARLLSSGFGTVDWQQRMALQNKPLALWLQLFFSRFRRPVNVAQLHALSGSGASLKEFRRKLAIALEELHGAGGHAAAIDRASDTVAPTTRRPPRQRRQLHEGQECIPFPRLVK